MSERAELERQLVEAADSYFAARTEAEAMPTRGRVFTTALTLADTIRNEGVDRCERDEREVKQLREVLREIHDIIDTEGTPIHFQRLRIKGWIEHLLQNSGSAGGPGEVSDGV